MVCGHLRALEEALVEAGVKETARGQVWSKSCREWVYFDCELDLAQCRLRFALPDCVREHRHRGTHDGSEQGLECALCQDGVMGRHPEASPGGRVFP